MEIVGFYAWLENRLDPQVRWKMPSNCSTTWAQSLPVNSPVRQTHARLSRASALRRMLLAAQEQRCVRAIALIAALTQGRNLLRRAEGKEMRGEREDLFEAKTSPIFSFSCVPFVSRKKISSIRAGCRVLE
jgi:hypothetical protein